MPVVNVNLSMEACLIYSDLTKERKASAVVSRLLIEYANLTGEEAVKASEWNPQMILHGDIRLMGDGRYCTFTPTGWIPCDFENIFSDLGKNEVESANEKWMREQKELNE